MTVSHLVRQPVIEAGHVQLHPDAGRIQLGGAYQRRAGTSPRPSSTVGRRSMVSSPHLVQRLLHQLAASRRRFRAWITWLPPWSSLQCGSALLVSSRLKQGGGTQVAFVRTTLDPRENRYSARIHAARFPAAADLAGADPQPAAEGVPYTSGPKRDGSPRWSPDGRYLAFISDREAEKGKPPEDQPVDSQGRRIDPLGPQIYVLPTGGGEALRITNIRGGVQEFAWSPDGRQIAFVSAVRRDLPQFLDEGGPEDARQGQGSPGAGGPREGGSNAGGVDAGGQAQAGQQGDDPREPDELERLWNRHNADVREITRLQYRENGRGYFEDRRNQVFVVDVDAALAAHRQNPARPQLPRPMQVTWGEYDHSQPAWAPDGRSLAVVACRDGDPDYQRFVDIWVFAVPPKPAAAASGTGAEAAGAQEGRSAESGENPRPAPRKVTDSRGFAAYPRFSPDGRQIAYLGHDRQVGWYTNVQVYLVDADRDDALKNRPAPRSLTAGFDRSFGDSTIGDMRFSGEGQALAWSADGRSLFALASDRGTTHLYAISATEGHVRRLTSGDIVVYAFSLEPKTGRLALGVATPADPGNIYVAQLEAAEASDPAGVDPLSDPTQPGGLRLTQITAANRELLSERTVSLPRRFRFRAQGGPELDGWAILPVGASGGDVAGETGGAASGASGSAGASADGLCAGRFPTVLEIHGGPQMMYASQFFFEFQVLASAGMGVLFCNPRGSQGYGQSFTTDIRGHWGEHDYADIMACVDAALDRFPWIDPSRLGVAGGSYGGFMTSWIIGHTDRFQAAVSMRALNNLSSFFGTSDGGPLWDEVFGGTPWQNPEAYARQSPIAYADHIVTPTLILHSEEDFRCPIEQAEQLYAALKVRRVEARMVRYPGENHDLSRHGRPWHRVHRLREIRTWFERHLVVGHPAQQAGKGQ
ncbi:MAG: S9 family peptidase [Firmicutes bacterium]|nr:S9 family peptidase [Bacillota bacterium]